jgi:hypothetical protein
MRNLINFAQILNNSKINIPQTPADQRTFTQVFNIVLATSGALAFLMLVIAGFRYTLSQGDPTKVADSKRTMTYSIVGLVVIALAATVVNFVLNRT